MHITLTPHADETRTWEVDAYGARIVNGALIIEAPALQWRGPDASCVDCDVYDPAVSTWWEATYADARDTLNAEGALHVSIAEYNITFA